MAERYDFYVHDNRKVTFNLTEPIMREDSGVTDFVFHIPKVLNELEVSEWSWWLVFVNAKKEKYSIALTLSDDPESPLESNIATYTVNYAMSIKAGSVQFALEAINAGTGGAIDNEWHTQSYEIKVKETLQGNQAEYAETESDIISELLQTVRDRINQLVGGATPEVKDSTAEMTDHKKIYVLSTDGNWYRYNGTAWVSGGQYASGITIDQTLTQSGQAADAKETGDKFNNISEYTRNLNSSEMGRWGNAVDGKIYARNSSYWGMASFIPVTAGESYTVSNYGLIATDTINFTYLFIDDDGTVISRNTYTNNRTRVLTAPTGAAKLNVFYRTNSGEITPSSNAYVQIEKGDDATTYIQPVSAVDAVLRTNLDEYPTYIFASVIGPIIEIAEEYFNQAYQEENNLVYDSTHGLFSLQTTSDNEGEEGHPAIVCSQFVMAMMKYITWDNSRYVGSKNHVGQSCFTSDGINASTQDGEPYPYSYYQYENGMPYDTNDIPSYDYMQSCELYRYALNHGYAYEIKERYPQLRPGDVIFSTDSESEYFMHVTHCAFCVYTGFDDGRVILLESNTHSYKDKTNVGCGVRNTAILSSKYGARFPLHALPHKAKIVEHGKTLNVTGSASYTVGILADMVHQSGFYTVIIKGSMPYTKSPQIGVLYDGDTSRTYYRLLCNGDTFVCFFYAPTMFNSISLGIDTGSDVTIDKVTVVKGYVPLT